MDFGSLSGRSSKSRDGSIKRKTFLGAFRKSSQPPSSFNPPPLPPPNASLPPLPASASSANPSFSLSSRGHPGKASSSRGASHPPGQPQGLPFDDEPTSPSAESYSSHGQSVGHTTLQSQSAWPGISGQGTSEWGAKGSMAPSVTASSWKGREGSLRGSSMGHGQYAESLASSSTAVFPSASIGRSGSTMGYGTATSSVTGERPRERAPSGKYSLTDANRRELADVKETKDRDKDSGGTQKGAVVRRPEDLVKVVKDRMFSWSYMMTWYQGDSHWFNTVKIPRSAAEAFLGPKQLEARARNYYVLGMSLGMLFDISGAPEFLRALTRVLEEWEIMAEGGGSKVKNLFKGQRGSRKTSGSGEYHSLIHHDGDSYLYNASLPFGLDFFQVHATLCSIIRDIYKKILKSFLPSKPPSSAWAAPLPDPLSLVHPSTIIHSAPLDTPFSPPLPTSSSHAPSASISSSAHGHAQGRPPSVRSPSTKSTSSFSSNPHQPTAQVHSRPGMQRKGSETGSQVRGAYTSMGEAGGSMQSGQGVMMPDLHRHVTAGQEGEYDAFQMFILGELPHDRTLVGDGQGMGKEVVELFTRADGKLRKHFSVLLRETDALARRVLDNEIHSVLDSFTPGSQPLQFDFGAALSLTAGNGYAVQHQQRMGPGAVA